MSATDDRPLARQPGAGEHQVGHGLRGVAAGVQDGRTSVGVVGDLTAARAFLDTHYPGRTTVHGNTGP
ncbi:hypothetical protein [Kitasatospora purpeofusca]|uniref:hypothetical protein n=1 Tax=Kitasatospora purpeofusca TaxID=67352 RepID=UPI00365BAC0D